MNIDELRKQVPAVATEFNFRGDLVTGLLLTAALICSLLTLVAENATWLSLSAILLVLLGLLYSYVAERMPAGWTDPAPEWYERARAALSRRMRRGAIGGLHS